MEEKGNLKKGVKKASGKRERVPSYESFLRIYGVLAQKSSPENPLSVSDIYRELSANAYTNNKEDTNRIRRLLNNPAVRQKLNSVFVRTMHTVESVNGSRRVLPGEHTFPVIGEFDPENRQGILYTDAEGTCPEQMEIALVHRRQPSRHTVKNQINEMAENSEDGADVGRVVCLVKNSKGKLVEKDSEEDDKEKTEKKTSKEDDGESDTRKCWYYLDNGLTPAQWNMLYNSVASNPYIDRASTEDYLRVLKKMDSSLGQLSNTGSYNFKMESQNLIEILAKLETAIGNHYLLKMKYGEYVLEKTKDGKYSPVLKVRPTVASGRAQEWRTVRPIALNWANGFYYLFTGDENGRIRRFRVDRIMQAELQIERMQSGGVPVYQRFERTQKELRFNAAQEREASPNMYGGDADNQVTVTLRATDVDTGRGAGWLNAIVDTFGGYHVWYSELNYNKENKLAGFNFRVTANKIGLKMFILEHLDIISIPDCPKNDTETVKAFRNELREIVKKAADNL